MCNPILILSLFPFVKSYLILFDLHSLNAQVCAFPRKIFAFIYNAYVSNQKEVNSIGNISLWHNWLELLLIRCLSECEIFDFQSKVPFESAWPRNSVKRSDDLDGMITSVAKNNLEIHNKDDNSEESPYWLKREKYLKWNCSPFIFVWISQRICKAESVQYLESISSYNFNGFIIFESITSILKCWRGICN